MAYFLINDRIHNAFFLLLSGYIVIWKNIFALNFISCVIIYLLISFEYYISFFTSLFIPALFCSKYISLKYIYSCFVFLKIFIFTWWIKQFISFCVMVADVFEFIYIVFVPSLVAQMVKHLSTMQETGVRSLGQENPLEKEKGAHSSTLA